MQGFRALHLVREMVLLLVPQVQQGEFLVQAEMVVFQVLFHAVEFPQERLVLEPLDADRKPVFHPENMGLVRRVEGYKAPNCRN